jgi:hypothetical protein
MHNYLRIVHRAIPLIKPAYPRMKLAALALRMARVIARAGRKLIARLLGANHAFVGVKLHGPGGAEMNETMVSEPPRIEQVVRSRQDLAGVQDPDGIYVPNERLGIGIVSNIRSDDAIELLNPDARVIAVYDRDGGAGRVFKRCKLASRAGLNHNWSVELFPDDVVRTIRSDGCVWTFNWYPLYERAFPIHTLQDEPRTDDDAEAITVAELAHVS